jgi:hypothetical protein
MKAMFNDTFRCSTLANIFNNKCLANKSFLLERHTSAGISKNLLFVQSCAKTNCSVATVLIYIKTYRILFGICVFPERLLFKIY